MKGNHLERAHTVVLCPAAGFEGPDFGGPIAGRAALFAAPAYPAVAGGQADIRVDLSAADGVDMGSDRVKPGLRKLGCLAAVLQILFDGRDGCAISFQGAGAGEIVRDDVTLRPDVLAEVHPVEVPVQYADRGLFEEGGQDLPHFGAAARPGGGQGGVEDDGFRACVHGCRWPASSTRGALPGCWISAAAFS